MIYSLTGKILKKTLDTVVISCAGVGYAVQVPLTTAESLPAPGREGTVYTVMNVTENDVSLYGFATEEQQACFEMLTAVSGVGPKVGLAILSVMEPDRVALAISAGDHKAFKAASGVGPKLAQRIVLELKDHGFTDGKVHIAHCDNPEAAKRLKLMIHAVFAGAQVDVAECGGLCSYYAEQGGLMVGYEDGKTE